MVLHVLNYICCFVILCSVQSLRLEVQPKRIEPGTTENLIINCSMPSLELYKMTFLNSIILSHSPDVNSTSYEDVASISTSNGLQNAHTDDAIARGVINVKGMSYLQFQWPFPYSHMSGDYKCEANGIGHSWRPLTLSATAKVEAAELSLSTLSKQLRIVRLESAKRSETVKFSSETVAGKLKNPTNETKQACSVAEKCDELKANLDTLTKQIDCVNRSNAERSKSLKSHFVDSTVFEGRKYYITRNLDKFSLRTAQATCEWYGGYLAEVDNDNEFHFVRQFVQAYSSLVGVWIGGSDEVAEGYWVNARSNSTLRYLNWGGMEPDGGREHNCLCLWKAISWYMADGRCSFFNPTGQNAYLCEIPE